MKLKTTLTAAALLAATSTVSVAAQDTSSDKLFDGPYIGADFGASDGGEIYYGANLGFRKQTDNNLVLGVEGTFGDYATEEDFSFFGQSVTAGIDYTWSVNGYVGFVFGQNKNNLLKLGAGYNNIHAYAESGGDSAGDTLSDVTGFVGYERAFNNKMSLRLQVNYLKIDDSDGGQATVGLAYNF